MNKQTQTGKNIEPLVNLLASTDDKVRRKARKSLVAVGRSSVSSLSGALQNSKVYKARWEAAKALGAIGDAKAIPSLVKALEDPETDVVWLAAEALKKFRKIAWPELLNALIHRGSESVTLRNAAHHVFRKQREEGFNDLLTVLRKALESGAVPESTPSAASNILKRMTEHSNHN
jgi:HEAT repeat protein